MSVKLSRTEIVGIENQVVRHRWSVNKAKSNPTVSKSVQRYVCGR